MRRIRGAISLGLASCGLRRGVVASTNSTANSPQSDAGGRSSRLATGSRQRTGRAAKSAAAGVCYRGGDGSHRARFRNCPQASQMRPISAWWLGPDELPRRPGLQHRLVVARAAGLIGDQLLLLEHEPSWTLGAQRSLARGRDAGRSSPPHIELIETERGASHIPRPGQLTAYAIIQALRQGLWPAVCPRSWRPAWQRACAESGVEAGRRDGFPGLLCGDGSRKSGPSGGPHRARRELPRHPLNVTVSLADLRVDRCMRHARGSNSTSDSRGNWTSRRAHHRIGGSRSCRFASPSPARSQRRSGHAAAGGKYPAAARAGLEDVLALGPDWRGCCGRSGLMGAGLFEKTAADDLPAGGVPQRSWTREFQRGAFALAVRPGG